MRYAIISDLHANRQAWNAINTDIRSIGVDRIVCLGDVVGYGPNPQEVLEAVYPHLYKTVLGNHDAVVAGRLSPSLFNDEARRLIEWTASQLDDSARAFLASLPLVAKEEDFFASHANPAAPEYFTYLLEAEETPPVWEKHLDPIIFTGHSHVPAIFVKSGKRRPPLRLPPQDFSLESGKRYIVNAGSVGHPRDHDMRACYCLFDSDRRTLLFRRIPFDIEAYRTACRQADLPAKHKACFVQLFDNGETVELPSLLEDFRPDKKHPALSSSPATPQKQNKRFPRTLFLLLSVFFLAGAIFLHSQKKGMGAGMEFKATNRQVISMPKMGENALSLPCCEKILTAETPFQDWTVFLEKPEMSTFEICRHSTSSDEQHLFRVSTKCPARFRLSSRPVAFIRGSRLRVEVKFRLPESSTVEDLKIVLLQKKADGREDLVLRYPLTAKQKDRWLWRHRSLPPGGLEKNGTVQWILSGQIDGELEIRACSLERRR